VGLSQTRQRLRAERVRSALGRFHTDHGDSAMRIYASYVAMNLGKHVTSTLRACCLPSSTRFNMLDTQGMASFLSLRARALVNFCFMEVSHFRSSAPMHHVTCPSMQHENAFQDDCALESRCQFYAVAGCVDFLPNSTHMTIGSEHYWDIARRMRKDLSQRSAAV